MAGNGNNGGDDVTGGDGYGSEATGWWWPIGSTEVEKTGGVDLASNKDKIPCLSVFSPFGSREDGSHKGIDISYGFEVPGLYIVATRPGKVMYVTDGCVDHGGNYEPYVNDGGGFGNNVVIDHGEGMIVTYAHLSNGTVKVNVGDTVEYGQLIGRMGCSGWSEGVHLHFQMELNGTPVDPEEYVSGEDPRPSIEYQDAPMSEAEFLLQFGGNSTVTTIAGKKYYKVYSDTTADGYAVGYDVDLKNTINCGDRTAYVVDSANGTPYKKSNAFAYALQQARKGIYIYIDQATCDAVVQSEIDSKQSFVDITESKLGGYKLLTQQRYHLMALWFRGWNDSDFVSAWNEAKGKYEINSWQFNKIVWEKGLSPASHTMEQYYGYSFAGYIKANDCLINTYLKGIYQVKEGTCFSHNTLDYYTPQLVSRYWVRTNPSSLGYRRNTSKDKELFTMKYKEPGKLNEESGDGYTHTYTSSNGRTYKLYQQWLGSYSQYDYWHGKMQGYGCLPGAVSIIVSGYVKGQDPYDIAQMQLAEGGVGEDNMRKGVKNKLNLQFVSLNSNDQVKQKIMQGKDVIVLQTSYINGDNGTYTYTSHYLAILDYKNGKVFIGDTGGHCLSGWASLDHVLNHISGGMYLDK